MTLRSPLASIFFRHELALALQHVDVHGRLVVDRGREHLAAGGRNRRVAHDDFRHHAAHGLDAERERRHVEQQHVAVAGDEDVGLDRRAKRHHLVRIQFAVRRTAEQLLDLAAHYWNPRRAADQHHLVDLRRFQSSVGERLATRPERTFDDWRDQRLKVGAGHAPAVERRLFVIGEIELRLNGGLAELLHTLGRSADTWVGFGTAIERRTLVSADDAIHQQHIDVVAAEVRIAVG